MIKNKISPIKYPPYFTFPSYTSEKLILNSSRLVTFKLDIADVIHATWTRDFYSNRTDIFHGDTPIPKSVLEAWPRLWSRGACRYSRGAHSQPIKTSRYVDDDRDNVFSRNSRSARDIRYDSDRDLVDGIARRRGARRWF